MKQPKPAFKKLLLLCAPIAFIAVIIGSCKKDSHVTTPPAANPAAVNEAKSWYEKSYPANTKLSVQAASVGQDWSQGLKPDWNSGATYTRFDDEVLEMPVNAAISGKLNIGLKEQTTGTEYKAANSKSSFLLIKSLGVYQAYIMTIIGDPSYLKGDLTKLDRNKYNKRDSAFTGVVLYSTPKGKFVNAWTYKNGAISGQISPDSASASTGKTQTDAIKANLTEITTCYTWTQTSSYNGQSTGTVVLDSYCVTTYSGTWDSGGGDGGGSIPGTGGGGGGGGGTTTPPSPAPCVPTNAIDNLGKISVNSVTVNQLQPLPTDPPGDGFPPPNGNVPCATVVTSTQVTIPNTDIRDSISTNYQCARALVAQLTTLNTNIARILYQAFGTTSSKSITFVDGPAADFTGNNATEDGHTIGYKVYLNPFVLANSSNEYRLVTLYHEAIHAYLNLEHKTLGDAGFRAKYPMVKVVAHSNFTSVVGADPYDYWIDPGAGYETKVVTGGHITMAEYFIGQLKDAILAYNPSFPADKALALAKGGIVDDSSIKYANDSERDIRKGNSVGTKCP
ncbi:hypothetical protein ABIC45_004706 [Mucilaginibacter rubeus]|uniref:hypothetical protein n=1 Tax=Mucilaginibacter rubeus TaxID=2027860 RepID=UPI00339B75A5